ncbi:MAG: hypothetical protein LBL70_07185 [Treponema sp.]|jgi:hypothetical protein|nr:hypothetical protein [Treponema sp.]
MKAYFIQIAAVRFAARLLGRELVDNYAFHGSLPRYRSVHLNGIVQADGIDKVPEKAACFNFGSLCGDIICSRMEGYTDKELLNFEAEISRNFFLDMSPEKRGQYTDAELKKILKTFFRVFLKKAQIRTHTAKPGREDINRWLAGYYGLQQDYEPYLSSLVDAIITPDPAMKGKTAAFFDRKDEIITLAMDNFVPGAEHLKRISASEPLSVFGKILREIVLKVSDKPVKAT